MRTVYFVFAIVTANHFAFAQTKEYKVKAGEYIGRVVKEDAYRFPEYRAGKVFNAAAKPTATGLLNYNIIFDEMRIVGKQGDTLAIGDPDLYPYIEIGNSQFLRDPKQGYFEIIDGNPKLRLLEKQKFVVKHQDLTGSNGYGSTSASPGASISATRKGSLPQSYVSSVDATYFREARYFFIDSKNEIVKANRSSLLNWYPDNRDEIRNFIKDKGINFESEADLVKVMKFVDQLK